MTIIEDYLDLSPEQAKRIIGSNWDQFQEVVTKADALHQQKQQARPRFIQGGGGRRRKLSVKPEILLTGDTAYIGEPTISTPEKKLRLGKLTPEQI